MEKNAKENIILIKRKRERKTERNYNMALNEC